MDLGTINTDFDRDFSGGLTYSIQFLLCYVALITIGIIFMLWQTKDLKNIEELKNASESTDPIIHAKLERIISKCMGLPLYSSLIISVLPTIIVSFVFIMLKFTSFADIKVILIVFTISLLAGSLAITFFKTLFKSVLVSINNTIHVKKSSISLTKTLIFQISSLLFVCMLCTFFLLYSNNMEEKSKILKEYYTYEVTTIVDNIESLDMSTLKQRLNQMEFISENDRVFLIDSNNNLINFNNEEVNDFFIKYALTLSSSHDNFVYDYYGTESQGVLIPIQYGNDLIKVVIQYDLSSDNLTGIFINLAIILAYCSFSIYFISHSVTKEISLVTESMNQISSNSKNSLMNKLPVTSSDEIGELITAFNDIQDLTKQNIIQIENSQQMLIERERLASLGQMIGGIAHNLKTPIMSVSGAAEGLTELVGEYISSIPNPTVTPEDHVEIAHDMLEWITKIKTHVSYMSDIITTVKGQASQLSTTECSEFTLYDLGKKVNILVKHEIDQAMLTLDTQILCDPVQTLHGDINNLIQVIINLISNSIQAYNGKINETIYFTIDCTKNDISIKIKDNGCGINKETQEKLFKEMITTKGKNGTGLGLYMSYSTIKGNFGGNITFNSKENVGTTFIITIPIKK